MKGGADTGFRHVKPEEYQPRLLHFCGTRRNIEVKEVSGLGLSDLDCLVRVVMWMVTYVVYLLDCLDGFLGDHLVNNQDGHLCDF